jgi:serine phosphatase RsbU (regulator of sigma subunit)
VLQTEIVISAIAFLIALGLAISNLFTRGRFTLNRFFAVMSFFSSIMFLIQFLQLINFEFVSITVSTRIYFGLILFLSELFFHIFQIYPEEDLRPKLKYVLLAAIPSIIFFIITVSTDLVIFFASFKGYLDIQFGNLFPVYILFFVFYMLGTLFLIIYKSKYKIESKVLKQELRFISYGLILVVLLLLIFVFFIPVVYKINTFRNIGITLPGIFILIIMNYAASDLRLLDFKIFYIKLVFWVLIFFILFIPIYLVIINSNIIFGDLNTAFSGIIFFSFIYMVLFYRFGKPLIDKLLRRDYLIIERNFEEFFISISQLTVADKHGPLWDEFYNKSIDEFRNRFEISGTYLFLLNPNDGKFRYVHGIGPEIDKTPIENNSIIVKNLNINYSLLDMSMIYSYLDYSADKEELIKFYLKHEIEIAIPFYHKVSGLIGILFLGYLPEKKLYSKTFITALDIYRIQFQRLLENGLLLEELRLNQVVEHDKMVVGGIKKKILPRELNSIDGIKISSFYMNNSSYGGDYYDSIKIGLDKIAIIISDSAYYGVESAIISLELFSAFHSRPRKVDTPDKILSVINWVLTTSRLTKKYAPTFLMTYSTNGEIDYSNAGYNPLYIFNVSENIFHSYTTKGIPIGVDKDFKYESHSIKVSQGSIGLLFSNGFLNAINPQGESYSIEKVKKIIQKNKDENATIITRRIYQDLSDFIKDKKQTNDVSLIIFKI